MYFTASLYLLAMQLAGWWCYLVYHAVTTNPVLDNIQSFILSSSHFRSVSVFCVEWYFLLPIYYNLWVLWFRLRLMAFTHIFLFFWVFGGFGGCVAVWPKVSFCHFQSFVILSCKIAQQASGLRLRLNRMLDKCFWGNAYKDFKNVVPKIVPYH